MKVFAVVKADGNLKRSQGGLCIYSTLRVAKGQCRGSGDSVVEVDIDLSRAPLHIRGQKL